MGRGFNSLFPDSGRRNNDFGLIRIVKNNDFSCPTTAKLLSYRNFLVGGSGGKRKRKKEKIARHTKAFSIRVAECFRVLFHFFSPMKCPLLRHERYSSTTRSSNLAVKIGRLGAIEGNEINRINLLKQMPQYQPTTTLNDTYTILGGNVTTVSSSY